jgi:hypothetical protein
MRQAMKARHSRFKAWIGPAMGGAAADALEIMLMIISIVLVLLSAPARPRLSRVATTGVASSAPHQSIG